MGRIDWDSDDRSFVFWGICTLAASVLWVGYFVGAGYLGFRELTGGTPFRQIALSLAAPAVMIGIFAFRLGRRQARRRKARGEDPKP